jgi:lipopolysaccharide transport system ATP-binding protein
MLEGLFVANILKVERSHARTLADLSQQVVSVRNLSKRYWLRGVRPATFQQTLLHLVGGAGSKPFWALRHVSFQIGPGESVAIIGANGAGKSTLLRLMCGLGRATRGDIEVAGRLAALLELGAGFQPRLTGRENLYVSAIVAGLRRRDVGRLFETIVDFAELGDFIDQPLRTYSSGNQMRLAFSVAIHVDPSIMIIDETLSVGDAHFEQKCLDEIEKLRRNGTTLLMVSHSMGLVRAFCTRALWLRRGTLVADGPVNEVISEYAAVSQAEALSSDRGESE